MHLWWWWSGWLTIQIVDALVGVRCEADVPDLDVVGPLLLKLFLVLQQVQPERKSLKNMLVIKTILIQNTLTVKSCNQKVKMCLVVEYLVQSPVKNQPAKPQSR